MSRPRISDTPSSVDKKHPPPPQLLVYLNQTVQGNYNGQLFSGVIMNSNMGNTGQLWNATISFAGTNMIMNNINGEVLYWIKN